MSRGARVWRLAAALIVTSCTSLSNIEQDRAAVWTRPAGSEASNLDLLSTRQRLHAVAFPILRAASEFCEVTRPFFGLSAAGGDSSPSPRRSARQRRPVSIAGARVLHAVPGSPADLAGLREGDVVISSNGVLLRSGTRDAQFHIDAAEPSEGFQLRLVLRRGSVRQFVQITPVEICDIEVGLTVSTATAAWARGNKVTVSDALLRFAASDDELAFTISHEVSHIILDHSASSFGRRSASLEREADHVGIYLMARAGYDAPRGIILLERLAEAFPWWDDGTQPPLRARYEAITKVANGIGQ